MVQYDFEESVGYWLTIAHQAYHREFSARLGPHGITYRQAQVLGWLASEGKLTQAELAVRMFIEPPSLVGVLDRMEQNGWIAREPCCQDRRKKWIVLQPAVEPVWQQLAECARQLRAEAVQGFSAAEIATLRRLLSRLKKNMTQAGMMASAG
jgi:MarR family transcriptional regulator, transcriptional regulator for hemolysin